MILSKMITMAMATGFSLNLALGCKQAILRHANPSTTQRYLGKVSDVEAMRCIEILYG